MTPQQIFSAKLAPGVPVAAGGGGQTPWLSDIDGGNFALTNVASLSVGVISANLVSPQQRVDFPSFWSLATEGGDFALLRSNDWSEVVHFTDTSKGIGLMWHTSVGKMTPDFALDVVGDINCTGSFLVNGVPTASVTVDEASNEVVIEARRSDGSPVTVRLPIGGTK